MHRIAHHVWAESETSKSGIIEYINTVMILQHSWFLGCIYKYYQPSQQSNIPPEPSEPLICAFYNSDFIIWSSLGSFYIPCFVMVTLYYRIIKVGLIFL